MIPRDLGRAARDGRAQYVLAQLATHGFDVNAQVEGGGATIGRMTLLSCCCCEIGKGHLALARALLDMGADPNLFSDAPGVSPLYNAVHGIGEANYEMVLLLLSAGADIHLRKLNGDTPLIETLQCFELRGDNRYSRQVNCRRIVRLLLRSGVALDGIDDAFRRLDPALGMMGYEARRHYTASRNLICDVRTAGGLRKSEMMLRKQVLTLRTMALRGRAAPRDNVMTFLVDCPNEIAWKILSYWRTEIYCDDGMLFIDKLSDDAVEAMLWTKNVEHARAELERRRESGGSNRFVFRIRDRQSETHFDFYVEQDENHVLLPCRTVQLQHAFEAYAAHRNVSVDTLRFFRNWDWCLNPISRHDWLKRFGPWDGAQYEVMSCGLANWCLLIRRLLPRGQRPRIFSPEYSSDSE